MARILLIDDDPQVRSVLEGFLNHDGHQVICADNGKEAFRLLERQRFDLMLTDIVMPEQDGFEVIMRVTLLPDRPRIIAIAGGSSRLSQQMLLSLASKMRIERVLAKPISYQQLSAAVTEVLATAITTTPPQAP
jgi:CheY-like chemotaxis protein